MIGRGQVHVFERARGLSGAVLRFGRSCCTAMRSRSRIRRGWPAAASSTQQAEKNELGAQLHFCITSDPTLRSHLRACIAQLEDVIAPAIANDLCTPANDVRTQLVAASLTAAFNLLAEQGASKTRRWTPEELVAQVDPVFTFLRGGLDALKQPRKLRRR